MITNDVNLVSTLIASSATVRSQLATVQEQVASGRVADSFSGLGRQARTSLDLRPAIEHNTVLQQNISAAQGRLDVTQTALGSISAIASKFFASANSLDRNDPTAVTTVAQQAKTALQQVADLINSKSGDVFVFAGTDTGNAPIPNTDPAVLGSDLLASDTARAPYSSTLTTAVPTVEVGDGQFVRVGILANANSAAVSSPPTTGSALRDTLKALASLAGLTPGTSVDATVTSARDGLNSAISSLATEQGVLGESQSALQQRSTVLTSVSTSLSTQLSSAEDVDVAEAITRASSLQVQLQASYQILAQSRTLSLANYLT